ncbi:MAG: hypothetical protein HRT35_21065 [Algicola sp.]|nr:hypothetical protein [Algicola sp.]
MTQFNLKRLVPLTVIICLLGLVIYGDIEYGGGFLFAVGFVYAAVLCFSLQSRPCMDKCLVGILILGVSNWFVFYSSVIAMALPETLQEYLMYLGPSLAGGVLTLVVMNKQWQVKLERNQIITVLVALGLSSLMTRPLLNLVDERLFEGWLFSLNSVLWCGAFTLAIVVHPSWSQRHRLR